MKQKRRITVRDVLPLVISFLIPAMIMIIIFIERDIFPFGDRSFLRTDLYHQYAPFFNELSDKLRSGESLFYSWDIGGGTNFAALYSYYLASPLNWLLILVPHKFVIEFITYSIVLKIALSGFTMAFYLKCHNHTKDWGIAFAGIFYAMSGYIAAYSWNIMWLDCILLFPLIILGLERLVKEEKPFLYCITLGLSIISNYYISIMICLFMIVYFIAQLHVLPHTEVVSGTNRNGDPYEKKRMPNYFKKIFLFGLFSLLAGCLAAVTLLPEVYALSLTASSNSTFPKTLTCYFPIFDMLARHMMTVDVHLKLDHWPNLYCGVAIFIFIPLYIWNKRVNYKEKFANLFLVAFMLLSFSFNMLNYIWHGFHFPNSLPARQSFIYVFLILAMCYQGYMGLKDRSTKQIVGAAAFGIMFALIAEKLVDQDSEEFFYYSFYLSALFIALYGMVAYLYRRKKVIKPFLLVMALMLVSLECAINMTVTSVTTVQRSNYMDMDKAALELQEMAKEQNPDLVFARYEKNEMRTKNDGAWLDYPSISTFSSMSYQSLSKFYKSFGMEASTNAYGSKGMTGIMESLLGVRYIFYKSDAPVQETDRYRLVGTVDGFSLYENTSALSLGYMLPSNIEELLANGTYPADNQTSFIRNATGIGGLFETIAMKPTANSSSGVADQSGFYYAYVVTSKVKKVEASHGEWTRTFENLDRHYLINLGYIEEGESIYFSTSDESTSLSILTYRLNEEKLMEAMDILKEQSLQLSELNSKGLKGSVDVKEDGLFFTSIAYDPGWTVLVDGVETEYRAFSDTYICFDLTKGTHEITMRYEPEGLKYGAILSALAAFMLILLALLYSFSDKTRKLVYIDQPYPMKWWRNFTKFMDEAYEAYEDDSEPVYKEKSIAKQEPIAQISEEISEEVLEELSEDETFETVELENASAPVVESEEVLETAEEEPVMEPAVEPVAEPTAEPTVDTESEGASADDSNDNEDEE